MSDTQSPPPDATPEQISSARAVWIAAGHAVARFDAAMAPPQAAAPAATPTPEATHDAPAAAPEYGVTLTPEQASALEDRLLAAGFTPAQVAAEMDKFGLVEDERTDEQRAWDTEHGFGTVHPPEAYTVNFRDTGSLGLHNSASMAASLAEWRSFGHGLQINPELFTSLVTEAARTGQSIAKMDDVSKALWVQDQKFQALQRAGSPEALQERNVLAGEAIKYAIDNGAKPVLIEALRSAGAFDNWWILQTLANHGAALRGWRAGL